jgi:hypothetical protein
MESRALEVRPDEPRYFAILVRGWEASADGSAGISGVWRFSVEDPHTGVRQGFTDLNALVAFLRSMIDRKPPETV